MNQFTFTGKQKTFTFSLMFVGLLTALICLFMKGDGLRFWSNFLHNTVFFVGISFISLFILCAKSLAYSGWQTVFKRVWEAMSLFMPIGVIFLLIITLGIKMGWHDLYHWADADSVAHDKLLQAKSPFLNFTNYFLFTLIVGGYWIFTMYAYRRLSLREDNNAGLYSFNKIKALAGVFLFAGGYLACIMIWLWVMSIDAHWYSTMFAWYSAASWLVSTIAFTVLMMIYLQGKGYFPKFTDEHMHDLGKYLFGFSIFWTYLWFSQFMLIWYANIGEETTYFKLRIDEYPVLFYGNLVINFLLPFFVLMRNSTKRKHGTMIFVAIFVFFGHWMDYFQMIKPGVVETEHHLAHAAHDDHGSDTKHLDDAHKDEHKKEDAHKDDHAGDGHDDTHGDGHGDAHEESLRWGFGMPGYIEFGMFAGFLGLFLFVFFTGLGRASLTPENDIYLDESYHHHA